MEGTQAAQEKSKMSIEDIIPNKVYRHFKGGLYRVIGIATHTETEEVEVVYSDLLNEEKIWVRPLQMFCSKVDKEKYPSSTQEYRFERWTPEIHSDDAEDINIGCIEP